MDQARNIETVRRFYAAGPSIHDSERFGFASPDIVWHVPGANRISGEYRTAQAVFRDMPARMLPLERWEISVDDVMANVDLVVATVRLSGLRYGRSIETRGAHVFRFDDSGRIVEAWGFTADHAGLDALLDPE
jgi:ketosteroid isomerase-like protein